MKIPRFWARASHDGYEAPGWSFDSEAEARQVAAQRAQLLAEVLGGAREPEEGRYLYGDRPVKEPVIETLDRSQTPYRDHRESEALVTRNAYGALCLNTANVVFADVDVSSERDIASVLDRTRDALVRRGGAYRLYRTKAGLRIAVLHTRMSPTGQEAHALFDDVRADRMYRVLCSMQDSFRARLTPKPWRIGVPRIPGTFPYRDAAVERAVVDWARAYDRARAGYAVCEHVGDLGAAASDELIQRVLAFHDERTLAPGKPLA